MSNRYVRTNENLGPRGDYFKWCRVEDNGSITFGDEQGNYAGGVILSENWYPKSNDYWHNVVTHLAFYWEQDKEYFGKIMNMLNENWDLIRNWVEEKK